MTKKDENTHGKGPWHIVNRMSGKHIGPFTTELDCWFARSIATPDWATGIDMDKATFDEHLADLASRH